VEYNPKWDLRALMLRQLEQIPYVKDLIKRLRRNPYLRKVCGYRDGAPCETHFSQMKKRIGAEGFRIIEAWLRGEALRLRRSQPLSAAGLVQAACIDGTDLPAWSSRDPHDTRRGLGDPELERQVNDRISFQHFLGFPKQYSTTLRYGNSGNASRRRVRIGRCGLSCSESSTRRV